MITKFKKSGFPMGPLLVADVGLRSRWRTQISREGFRSKQLSERGAFWRFGMNSASLLSFYKIITITAVPEKINCTPRDVKITKSGNHVISFSGTMKIVCTFLDSYKIVLPKQCRLNDRSCEPKNHASCHAKRSCRHF